MILDARKKFDPDHCSDLSTALGLLVLLWLATFPASAQDVGEAETVVGGPGAIRVDYSALSAPARDYLESLEEGAVVRFETRAAGETTVLVPEDRPDSALPIEVAGAIDLTGWDHLPFQATVVRLDDDTVQLERPTLQLLADWDSTRDLFPRPLYPGIHREYEALSATVQRLMTAGGMSDIEATVELEGPFRRTLGEVLEQYAAICEAAPLDDPRRVALVRQIAEAERTDDANSRRKAQYGLDDRFRPSTYLQIYRASQAAVGLIRDGEDTPRCSGVVIAESVALTARHCLYTKNGDRLAADELWVVFDYVLGNEGEWVAVEKILESPTEDEQRDFALLHLDESRCPAEPEAPRPASCASERAVCLSDEKVRADFQVYGVGHPDRAVKMVADNSKVHFPFEVERREFHRLQARIEDEFGEQPKLADKVQEFKDSYRPVTDAAGAATGQYRYFRKERWGHQPIFGVDTDTYQGNSGSPIYNRRSRKPAVIGLLVSGMKDRQRAWKPGWDAHEGVLPATEIIERLDKALPDWRQRGVCVR